MADTDNRSISTIAPGEGLYYQLLAEAVNLLQDYSSEKWTDYNEHDPGLTIIENLVYALTEIMNKTEIPIQDILTQQKGMKLKSGDNGFYTASNILTTNPVTASDYKKLIIDRISNVKNVHFIFPDQEFVQVNGLFEIWVEMSVNYKEISDQRKEESRIKKAVQELFLSHRNLCQDLYNVNVYKPFYYRMEIWAKLRSDTKSVNSVLTSIFETVNNYLSPDISFYSLAEMQKMGYSNAEIFQGPRLNNGFILDSELTNPLRVIEFSEIIKRISRIPEVLSIEKFELKSALLKSSGSRPEERTLVVPADCVPYLLFPTDPKKTVFFIDSIQMEPDLELVRKEVLLFESINYSRMTSISTNNELPIPQGNFRDLEVFPTVRNQFPMTYRIGTDSFSNRRDQQRHAHAKQLQAYLLPFEQIMGNFLAQLQNVYTLFDTSSGNQRSYFYQVLQDMNDVLDLIAEGDSEKDAISKWNMELSKLNKLFDSNADERLNQIANNLLLRFSEELDSYTLNKISNNLYGKQASDSALDTKRRLINAYDKISYNRNRSFDYTRPLGMPNNGQDNIVGLIRKLCILLDIEDYGNRSLTGVIYDSGIRLYGSKEGLDLHSERLQPLLGANTDEWMIMDNMLLIDKGVGNLENTMIYVGQEETLLENVLLNGINPQNYEIKETSGERDKKWYLLYKNNRQLYPTHISQTQADAEEILANTIAYLVKVNQNSEGMHLVEHLLLAPTYSANYYGFELDMKQLNPDIKVVFQQFELVPLMTRNKSVKYMQSYFYANTSQAEKDKRKNIWIEDTQQGFRLIMQDRIKKIAVSKEYYQTQEEAEAIIVLINHMDANNSDESAFNPVMYAYYGPNRIEESFFTFQMSFFLPNWPARFQNLQFQKLFNNTLQDQAPVQIENNIYWLNIADMTEFEKLYFGWINLMQSKESEEDLQRAKYKLLCYIQMYLKDKQAAN